VHTVLVAPLRSTARPSTATGPTLTPQAWAGTWATSPVLASLRTLTSPTATLTWPSWFWVGGASRGCAACQEYRSREHCNDRLFSVAHAVSLCDLSCMMPRKLWYLFGAFSHVRHPNCPPMTCRDLGRSAAPERFLRLDVTVTAGQIAKRIEDFRVMRLHGRKWRVPSTNATPLAVRGAARAPLVLGAPPSRPWQEAAMRHVVRRTRRPHRAQRRRASPRCPRSLTWRSSSWSMFSSHPWR
jgi:hypothetical protein